jgi:hypothetical protein
VATFIRSFTLFTALLVLAAVSASCSNSNQPTIPTAPTPVTTTETFTGTINKNGAFTHTFFTTTTGTVQATLTALDPESTTNIGFSMGTYSGSTCAVLLANDSAVKTSVITGSVNSAGGNLCIRVYDVGKITEETTYEVQVVHP